MTSFKSAQLIASSGDADKVIFLVDRIELGTQSLNEYRGFALDSESVQGTDNTAALIKLLLSEHHDDRLIVTSIQKLSRLRLPSIDECTSSTDGIGSYVLTERQARTINAKRLVIIVDECHRSNFGEMSYQIRQTFPHAIFFGFTGTPIHDENKKKELTTAALFGNELHRYSIADGIRDHNVLGFDCYQVATFKPSAVREVVALDQAKASSISEALGDPQKKTVYLHYLNDVPMVGGIDEAGRPFDGIEDFLPTSQYRTAAHQQAVVSDIVQEFPRLSVGHKFHALLATSSISEALEYYELFRDYPELKVTCLFDSNIDNDDAQNALNKEWGMKRFLADYNQRYDTNFAIPTFADFKRDVAARLAHKGTYCQIELTPAKQLDLLIVVDQMLTGYDSPWLNTLYLDKVLTYESIIQAFSRTNRLLDADKPFGIIKYYRKPYTMKRNIEAAVKLYSGDRPLGLFVESKQKHACKAQAAFTQIKKLFTNEAGKVDWSKLPEDEAKRQQFVKHFNMLNQALRAARIQGLSWDELPSLSTVDGAEAATTTTTASEGENPSLDNLQDDYLNEHLYTMLVTRSQDLLAALGGEHQNSESDGDVPYNLEGYITSIDSSKIDTDYMNSRFIKYLKRLLNQAESAQIESARQELHQTFAYLTQEEQKAAALFLSDIESGDLKIDPDTDKTFRDYITDYLQRDYDDKVHAFAQTLGLNEPKLRALLKQRLPEKLLDQNPDYKALINECDLAQAKSYLESHEHRKLSPPLVKAHLRQHLRPFLLSDGEYHLEP